MMQEVTRVPENVVQKPSLGGLFTTFLRLGLIAFGGPAAMVHIRNTVVEKKKWIGKEVFRNGMALCQTIPGATGMQLCAYVGLQARGFAGALVCYVGFILPSFALMMALSALYAAFQAVPFVVSVFGSLRALIVALMAFGAWNFGKSYLKKWEDFLIAIAAAALFWFGLGPVWVLVIAAALGIALKFRRATEVPKQSGSNHLFVAMRGLVILLAVVVALLIVFFFTDRRLFDLALLMMKVDFFAYGGGAGSIPLMLHEVVDLRHWMTTATFMDGIALGQVTPGPIVITATFVGSILQGALGGIVASGGVFLPSFVLVILITPFFSKLQTLPLFRKAIDGVLCSFVGLILSVALRMGLGVAWDLPRILLALGAFAALILRVEALWVILAGVGISFFVH